MDISLINIIITFISLAFIFLLIFSFKLKSQRDKLIFDNNKLEVEIITKNNELGEVNLDKVNDEKDIVLDDYADIYEKDDSINEKNNPIIKHPKAFAMNVPYGI